MVKVMILGADQAVSQLVVADLKTNKAFDYVIYSGDLKATAELQQALAGVDVVYGNLTDPDVDQKIELIFDALRANHQTLSRFIFVTAAGVNGELIDQRPLTAEQRELRWQQQYAIKIIDEAEIDYTIIRQSPLTSGQPLDVKVYPEGQPMPMGTVTAASVANVSVAAITTDQFVNESIGLIDHLTTEE